MKKILIIVVVAIIFAGLFWQGPRKDRENTIKFSSWGSHSETEIIKSVISDFEAKNPNIKIEFIHIPENYFEKLQLLFAAGLQPDIVFFNNQNIQMYINADLLEDLTPYFSDADTIFNKTALDCFRQNGKLYAIPRDLSNLVIYYNRDMFKQKRIPIPSKIANIFELKELAEKFTEGSVFGINADKKPLYWLYYLASNGGGAVSDDKKSIIINSPKSLEALTLYTDFIKKYNIAPSEAQTGSMTLAQMFINKKLAMYLGGRWMVPKFRELADFDWDVLEFPASKENKVYVDASGWAISKKALNKKAAVEFIKYLSSENTINKFTENGIIIPARNDSVKSSNFLNPNKKPKNSIVFIRMLENAKPTPVTEKYPALLNELEEDVDYIFSGENNLNYLYNEKKIKELESLL